MLTVAKLCIIWAHFNTASPAHDTAWFQTTGPISCEIAAIAREIYLSESEGVTVEIRLAEPGEPA